MERDNYNIPLQECISTLNGPFCKPCSSDFLGNKIYENKKPFMQNFCDEKNTYTDCQGNVKFTLPLDSYKNIPKRINPK